MGIMSNDNIVKYYRSSCGPYIVTVYYEKNSYTYEDVIEVALDNQFLVIKYCNDNKDIWTEYYKLDKIESWRIHTRTSED